MQIIPHITNEIKEFIYRVGETGNADVIITEIGGTVGDIEVSRFWKQYGRYRWNRAKKTVCSYM